MQTSKKMRERDRNNLLMKWTNTKYINCPCIWNWDYKLFSYSTKVWLTFKYKGYLTFKHKGFSMNYFGFMESLLPAFLLKLRFMKDEVFKHLIQLRTILLNTWPGSNTVPEQVVNFISSLIKLQMFLELKHKNISWKELFKVNKHENNF